MTRAKVGEIERETERRKAECIELREMESGEAEVYGETWDK